MHISTNYRERVDNIADKAHFGPVHGAPIKLTANVFEGHTAEQAIIGASELKTVAIYHDPSCQITHMSGEMNDVPI